MPEPPCAPIASFIRPRWVTTIVPRLSHCKQLDWSVAPPIPRGLLPILLRPRMHPASRPCVASMSPSPARDPTPTGPKPILLQQVPQSRRHKDRPDRRRKAQQSLRHKDRRRTRRKAQLLHQRKVLHPGPRKVLRLCRPTSKPTQSPTVSPTTSPTEDAATDFPTFQPSSKCPAQLDPSNWNNLYFVQSLEDVMGLGRDCRSATAYCIAESKLARRPLTLPGEVPSVGASDCHGFSNCVQNDCDDAAGLGRNQFLACLNSVGKNACQGCFFGFRC
mmetsp:Transcript_9211/g.19120  ORF Transcript_9211/g.19120 Transcript_9211/m.19120 type:complete len:275 (+) Transcript_9211:955-1779(+)